MIVFDKFNDRLTSILLQWNWTNWRRNRRILHPRVFWLFQMGFVFNVYGSVYGLLKQRYLQCLLFIVYIAVLIDFAVGDYGVLVIGVLRVCVVVCNASFIVINLWLLIGTTCLLSITLDHSESATKDIRLIFHDLLDILAISSLGTWRNLVLKFATRDVFWDPVLFYNSIIMTIRHIFELFIIILMAFIRYFSICIKIWHWFVFL